MICVQIIVETETVGIKERVTALISGSHRNHFATLNELEQYIKENNITLALKGCSKETRSLDILRNYIRDNNDGISGMYNYFTYKWDGYYCGLIEHRARSIQAEETLCEKILPIVLIIFTAVGCATVLFGLAAGICQLWR